MYQTAGTVTIRAEGKAKEMQVSWLGQCFQGDICQSNTKTERSTGRWWGGSERCLGEGRAWGDGRQQWRWRSKTQGVGSEDRPAVQVLVMSLVAE